MDFSAALFEDNPHVCCFVYFHSKLKQYIWPPVPNLDKFLQGFLTEINGQKWVK